MCIRDRAVDAERVGTEITEFMLAPEGAWIVEDPDGDSLLVQQPLPLAQAPEPELQQVAVQAEAETLPSIGPRLDRVSTVDGEVTRILDETALAFFANPVDERVLAFLTPQPPERVGPEWLVIDGREVADDPDGPDGPDDNVLERFSLIPSNVFVRGYLPFFDQFAPQTRVWSPDGSRAVLSGREVDGVDGAWIIDGSGEAEPSRIVDATVAFWRPA